MQPRLVAGADAFIVVTVFGVNGVWVRLGALRALASGANRWRSFLDRSPQRCSAGRILETFPTVPEGILSNKIIHRRQGERMREQAECGGLLDRAKRRIRRRRFELDTKRGGVEAHLPGS